MGNIRGASMKDWKEIMWVMSLLTFEKLLDIVKDSREFEDYTTTMKERTIQ